MSFCVKSAAFPEASPDEAECRPERDEATVSEASVAAGKADFAVFWEASFCGETSVLAADTLLSDEVAAKFAAADTTLSEALAAASAAESAFTGIVADTLSADWPL